MRNWYIITAITSGGSPEFSSECDVAKVAGGMIRAPQQISGAPCTYAVLGLRRNISSHELD